MTLFNKFAAAVITVGVLSTSVIAADAMADTTKAAMPMKHKKHKKMMMADSTAMAAPAMADSTAPMKKHKKHKKAAMADSSAMAPAAK